jgi:hypothetical protein
LTTQALDFLSNASNETLGACLVAIGASTYLVLGRVGLVIMGVVGGVVLHASWEANSPEAKQIEERRRELGLDVAKRTLAWRQNIQGEDEDGNDEPIKVEVIKGMTLDFSDFKPETAEALTELADAVIRDYVKYTYHLPHPQSSLPPNS